MPDSSGVRKQINRQWLVAVLLFSIIVLAASSQGWAGPSAGQTPTLNKWNQEAAYSWLIFTDGTTTYMKNGDTGAVPFSSTNTAAVFNDAIGNSTGGGLVHAKAGNYPALTAQTTFIVSGE